ncbi:MAG: phosphodiester glycosidase family protein [Desulfobacteraceae bacterium]
MTWQGYNVLRLIAVLILLVWNWTIAILPARAQGWSHGPLQWEEVGKGLRFAKLTVSETNQGIGFLFVVYIDPNFNAFRIFHGQPQSIIEWQESTGALVVFNASYFRPNDEPCGLIIADGELTGPLHNSAMRGMFVSEPKGISPDLPRATILDLTVAKIQPKNLPWTQGVQSFPLLLDSQGRIRVKKTSLMAPRTVICTDHKGNILVFNSPDKYFTLYELAGFLKSSEFEIDTALNLDGGSMAQLMVKTSEFNFSSPSFLERQARGLIDPRMVLLPTVIGVFPRHH